MQSTSSKFAVRLLPSLTDFAFLMPIVFLFGRMDGAKTLLSDCDTGWHIRTGEWILANHRIPAHDFFSFTRPGAPWFAWEWLSDIIMAWLNSHGGLATVVVSSVVLLSVTFTLLYRLALRRANPIVAVAFTMVGAAASAIHWLARPHLFTLLFLVLFYRALENVREGRTHFHRIPFLVLLPAATILWTNLHGGFFFGIVMICAYGTGDLLKMLLTPDGGESAAARQRSCRYFLSAAGCLAASLINPYFYHLHVHVAQYVFDPFQAEHIVEFLTLNFHHPVAMFFEALLVLGTGAAIWHAFHGSYTEAVLMLLWGHAALLASRNIALFGIVAAPLVASAADGWLNKLPQLNVAGWVKSAARRYAIVASETADTDALPRWHIVSAAAVVLVAALVYAPAPPRRFRPEYDPKSYPAGAIPMLRSDVSARIFTNDEWGDYLIYRLYPGHKVFVDGRSDFYGDDFEQKYLDVMSVKYGWEQTLGDFGINTILLPPDAPLAGALKESNRWHVVYDDGISLVFRPAHQIESELNSAIRAAGEGSGCAVKKTSTAARQAKYKT